MPKEKTASVTVRVPKGLLARVDAYAQGRDLTRTAAVVALLRIALGSADDAPATAGDLKALRLELAAGMERVSQAVESMPVQALAALPSAQEAVEEERERIRSLGVLDRLLGRF